MKEKKTFYDIELFHWVGMPDDHIENVIEILNAHPEYYNITNKFGDNCLFIATQSGNFEIVKYLVENTEIDINHQNLDRLGNIEDNVLMYALKYQRYEIANYFINQKSINFKTKKSDGKTIYHLVAEEGNDDFAESLIEKDKSEAIRILDKKNQHCLFDFIENYFMHKNFLCFDLLQERLTPEILLTKNINGVNIIEFIQSIQLENISKQKEFEPLINILRSRF